MTARTVVIGLDGATFTVLDALMAEGEMPFLSSFVASGVRAELRTVIPPLTPPAWTSLATGLRPGRHGIFDFFIKEAPDARHIRFVTFHDIHAETIWAFVNRYGRRATVLNFPIMFPPPTIDGYVVSGFIPWRQLRLGCHPASLYNQLKAMPGFNPKELAMDMDLEEKAIEGCEAEEYEDWIQLHTRREKNWVTLLRHLMQEDPCELTAVLFDGVDKIQHLCWRFLDPAYQGTLQSPWEWQVRELCVGYFRQMDALLAEIAELAGPDATLILASDHGFGPQTGTFFLNTWLAQRGYLAWADGKGPEPTRPGELGVGQLARHTYQLDWERTLAYAPTPSGNGIFIVRAGPGSEHGVPADEYEAFRRQLQEELLAFREPETGQPVVQQVWTREEVFAGPYMGLAPDLTLELCDRGLISIIASDVAYRPRPEPSGTHRREGVFLARGPALRQGVSVDPLEIVDVAPLVLYQLGVPVPTDWDGRIPTEIIEPAALAANPPQTVQVSESKPVESTPPAGPMLDEEAEAELLRRLQALGYVE